MPLLAFPANDIDVAGLPVDAPLPVDWLSAELADAELTAVAPGHIKGRLSRSGASDIVVHGRVQARVSAPCARCLGPTDISIEAELSLLLRPARTGRHPGYLQGAGGAKDGAGAKQVTPGPADKAATPAAPRKAGKPNGTTEPEYEFSTEEADLDVYDGETVVLDEFVREAILLELPSFPLCSEACPGIRPAAPGVPAEDERSAAPEPLASAEGRPASIDDLRERFAQRSGRLPGALGPQRPANGSAGAAPRAEPGNETPKKKSNKE